MSGENNINEKEKLVIDIKLLFDIDLSECTHNTFMNHINKYLSVRKYTDMHNDVISYIVRVLEEGGYVDININIPSKFNNVRDCIIECVKDILICNNIPYTEIYVNYEKECDFVDKLKPEGKLFGYIKYTTRCMYPIIERNKKQHSIDCSIDYVVCQMLKLVALGVIEEKENEKDE